MNPVELFTAQFDRQQFDHLLTFAEAIYVRTFANQYDTYRVRLNGVVFYFSPESVNRQPRNPYWLAVNRLLAGDGWAMKAQQHLEWGNEYYRVDKVAPARFAIPVEAFEYKHGYIYNSGGRPEKLVVFQPASRFAPARRVEFDLRRMSKLCLELVASVLNSRSSRRTVGFDSEMGLEPIAFEYLP